MSIIDDLTRREDAKKSVPADKMSEHAWQDSRNAKVATDRASHPLMKQDPHSTVGQEVAARVHSGASAFHLKAAAMLDKADEHAKQATGHRAMAAEHEKAAAGGEFDESKHPRDENGKFQ